MGNSSITTRVQARVPNELMRLKGEFETMSEFVIRAMKTLRDGHVQSRVEADPLEHQLLAKMVKTFAKEKVKMKLEKEEVELVKRLFKE